MFPGRGEKAPRSAILIQNGLRGAGMNYALRQEILRAQRNEITENIIYERLAKWSRDNRNREVLKRIAREELEHYRFWKGLTGEDVEPDRGRVRRYSWIARIFGLTFGIKLMERGEEGAQAAYGELSRSVPGAARIAEEENEHERALIDMIDEERLSYIGSMVLGLNDAIVELLGALAGFTLALRHVDLIAMTGLITGIAGSLSMASSEYLSTKSEGGVRSPLKAALYTGAAYILAVFFLISPYLVMKNCLAALGTTLANAIIVILVFTFYISIAKDMSFRHRFLEMAGISLGVAVLSFGVGWAVRLFLGVEI